jgi:hypothetical protein
MPDQKPPPLNGIILELTPIGNLLRVAAVDPETLVEVVFQAPLSADETMLAALARRKLAYALGRSRAVGS